jgi:hypothetical protein
MNKPDRITNDVVEISNIHCIAGVVEAERSTDGYTGPIRGNFLIAASDMFEVVSNYIH